MQLSMALTTSTCLQAMAAFFQLDDIQWSIVVEVDPRCSPLFSPLANTANLEAEDADGNPVTDESDDNTDLDNDMNPDNDSGGTDDPSLVFLPDVAITKAVTNSTALANGSVMMDFRFNVENTGNANLSNLSLLDPLNFTAAIVGTPSVNVVNVNATAVPSANGSYNGNGNNDLLSGAATDMLKPGEAFVVNLSVEIDPALSLVH